MKAEYEAWIKAFAKSHGGEVRNKCVDATNLMVTVFPELRQIRGFVVATADAVEGLPEAKMTLEDRRLVWDLLLGVEQHAWCVTPEGRIVDPTRAQYKEWPNVLYVAFDEEKHGPMPQGKCHDCGELLFPPETEKSFCNAVCRERTERYLAEERKKWMVSV